MLLPLLLLLLLLLLLYARPVLSASGGSCASSGKVNGIHEGGSRQLSISTARAVVL